jgi:O-antigen ligase
MIVLSLPFSESLKTISILLALGIFFIQAYRKEINPGWDVIHYGFISLLLASIISSIFAADPSKSLKGAKDILFYTTTFFVACTINDERQIRTILWSLYMTTTISAILGIFHSITGHRPLEIHALGNQNYTAMFYMIIITSMISTVLFSNKETLLRKSILIIFTIISLIASVMTLMRASFLGLLTFFLLLVKLKKPSRSVVFLILGFIFLTMLILYSDSAMRQKLLTTQSMISRLDIWKGAAGLFLDNPLTGVGLNHFNYRFPSNHPVEPDNIVYDAHSLYFQTASQMGLIGLVALMLIIVGFVKQWLHFKERDGFGKALRFGAMGAFLIIIITGVFDTTLHHEHAIAFTIITGLTYGYFRSANINGF